MGLLSGSRGGSVAWLGTGKLAAGSILPPRPSYCCLSFRGVPPSSPLSHLAS